MQNKRLQIVDITADTCYTYSKEYEKGLTKVSYGYLQ